VRDAIYDLLSGDATLLATLTGGVYDAAQVGEISRQTTAAAFDANQELLPCALLKLGALTPVGPYVHSARLTVSIYLYELAGYTNVEVARERIYTLLHRQTVTPAAGGCWEIVHTDDVLDVRDSALNCSLAISRFAATIRRA
jgi:hypothetical protein